LDNSVVIQAVEELAHWEMIATMIFKLTQGATISDVRAADFGGHYAIWDSAIFPGDSNGVPWSAAYINTMGDPIADLHEDMAAEQKARATYENLIRLTDDTDLQDGLKFLRERESSTSSASVRPWTTSRATWTAGISSGCFLTLLQEHFRMNITYML
jgi:Mn-containing catalase